MAQGFYRLPEYNDSIAQNYLYDLKGKCHLVYIWFIMEAEPCQFRIFKAYS